VADVERWHKRIAAAEDVRENWEKRYRIPDCYQYWAGNQLRDPFDGRGDRKIQLNLVASAVRAKLPSLYFYNPTCRVLAAPERADTSGETVDAKAQLLQDTGNYLARDGAPSFREHTQLALKEAEWAFGCVEVGYSADFSENPNEDRPALKESEREDVKDADGLRVGPDSDLEALEAELTRLQDGLAAETFYVKHIPAKQIMVSSSDKCIIEANDWIGYWEDHNLEDIKRNPVYKNTKDLRPSGSQQDDERKRSDEYEGSENVRLRRIWDLRTRQRFVVADGHKAYLIEPKAYERLPLFFIRPDKDPYHFHPKPPIYQGLSPQEEYNDSREHLRKLRKATVPRYTYDEGALDENQITKLESEEIGTYIPRNAGTQDPILPVNQPTYAENALSTLSISEREFNALMGVPAEFRQSSEQKSATQSVIQNQQAQVQGNYDRSQVADWLAAIIQELIYLSIDHMNIDRWIAVNVDLDSPMAPQEAQAVATTYEQISAEKLRGATDGIRWKVHVDVESLSPVSEDQKRAVWMQMLTMLSTPNFARLFSLSPQLLKITLNLNGLKNGREQDAIFDGLQKLVMLEMKMAQMNAAGTKGVASQPGQPGPPPGPSAPQELPPPPEVQ
jgi:hypothetical protein